MTAAAGEWVRSRLPAGLVQLVGEDGGRHDLGVRHDSDGLYIEAPTEPGRYVVEGHDLQIAVAPKLAWSVRNAAPGRRLWGAAAQLYSLRGRRDAAFGDFGALAEFAASLGRRGADALAISPVHALFAADPANYSPYAPSTRMFLNVLFAEAADVDARPPGGELIDWSIAGPTKLASLRQAFEHFLTSDEDHGPLQRFRAAGGEDLERHARFEALSAHFLHQTGSASWRSWPIGFHGPAGAAVDEFVRDHAADVDFHVYLQWRADEGLRRAQAAALASGMAVGLISDLAVGMNAGGSHAWSRPHDLLGDLSIGAPPDVFQPAGQDWGLTTFSPRTFRRTGHEAFSATLAAAMKHAGGVRIDHAMGLRRLWLTPRGATPQEGGYLSYPFEDMLRLIALESWRSQAIVVGEDLGTVPEGFREATTAVGMMGMRVLWFERQADDGFASPASWSRDAMAMTSTHDLPTVAGWWRGRDIDWMEQLNRKSRHDDPAAERAARETDRERLWRAAEAAGVAQGVQPPLSGTEDAVDAAVALIAGSGCDLAIVPLEDLLGLVEQPNLPGTIDEHPNWRRRLKGAPDVLLEAPHVAHRLEGLRRERPRREAGQ